MEPVRLWRYMVPAGSDLYGKQKPAWTDLARVNPSPYEQEYAALPRADFTALLAEHDALREALILWQEWSANYSPAECADGSGYYSESDHDQAECAKIARAALSASAAPPPSPPPPPSRVESFDPTDGGRDEATADQMRAVILMRPKADRAAEVADMREAGVLREPPPSRVEEARRALADRLLDTVASVAPSFEDKRVGYVEVQVDRGDWLEARRLAAERGEGGGA